MSSSIPNPFDRQGEHYNDTAYAHSETLLAAFNTLWDTEYLQPSPNVEALNEAFSRYFDYILKYESLQCHNCQHWFHTLWANDTKCWTCAGGKGRAPRKPDSDGCVCCKTFTVKWVNADEE